MVREFRQGVAAMRALSAAKPPNSIVRLLDSDDAQLAFSMTLVEGVDLRNVAERGWTGEKKVDLFRTLCEAVEFAHSHRVIHRDLKPANIVVDPDGRPVLTDFDLADLLTLGTLTGRSAGSLAYAAPEQVEPSLARDYGSRLVESDIYSLGRILFFLVAERDPPIFNRSTELPELAAYEGLRGIARRCTLDDPRRRYANVGALLSDLRRHQTEPGSVGCEAETSPNLHSLNTVPPREPLDPTSSTTRHPMVIGVVVALIGGVAAITAALVGKASPDAEKAAASSRTTTPSAPSASSALPSIAVASPSSSGAPDPASSAVIGALTGAASQRRGAWLTRGIGAHSKAGETRPLREAKLSLEPNEVQIGSFRCRLEFDNRGDPSRAESCEGRGAARTSVSMTLPLRRTEADDGMWVNCWSDEFQYSTGSRHKEGLFSLTMRMK